MKNLIFGPWLPPGLPEIPHNTTYLYRNMRYDKIFKYLIFGYLYINSGR